MCWVNFIYIWQKRGCVRCQRLPGYVDGDEQSLSWAEIGNIELGWRLLFGWVLKSGQFPQGEEKLYIYIYKIFILYIYNFKK